MSTLVCERCGHSLLDDHGCPAQRRRTIQTASLACFCVIAACALLGRLGVQGIRLFEEVEPGVPLGVTIGDVIFPVVTKAGAFGGEGTFVRCHDHLHGLVTG